MMPRAYVVACLLVLAVSVGVSAGFAPFLPDTVPTHWNLRGEADDYGSKWVTLLLFPAVVLGMGALLNFLPLLGPFRRNLEQSARTYSKLVLTFMTAFVGIQIVVLIKSLGAEMPLGAAMSVVFGLLFVALGNSISKIRRNFYLGIRTPWTLASEEVWERTHRLGGRMFVGFGAAVFVTGLFGSDVASAWVLFGGLGAIALSLLVYSCVAYRRLAPADELS